jgi:hypothetical protein
MPHAKRLNEDCVDFVNAVGLADAQKKCDADVLGNVTRPFLEFNGSCVDFMAELAAIRVLKSKGYDCFRAIHKKQPDGTTSDYEAFYEGKPAYLEVKNMRPRPTMLDVFARQLELLFAKEPSDYPFAIAFEFPHDNPPTAEQERRIAGFLASIRGRKPPFREQLDLDGIISDVTVSEGSGKCMLTRGMGPDFPEPVDRARFLRRIRDKAEDAYSQMRNDSRLKVVVINWESPSGSVSRDYIHDAEQTVRDVFQGAVDAHVLFYLYPAD